MGHPGEETRLEGRVRPRAHRVRRAGLLDGSRPLPMIADHPGGLAWHAIHEPRLVEVNMALHEDRGHPLSAGIVGRALRSEVGLDGHKKTVAYAHIDRRLLRATLASLALRRMRSKAIGVTIPLVGWLAHDRRAEWRWCVASGRDRTPRERHPEELPSASPVRRALSRANAAFPPLRCPMGSGEHGTLLAALLADGEGETRHAGWTPAYHWCGE